MTPYPRMCAALVAGMALGREAEAQGLLVVANKGNHTLSIVDPAAGHQIAAVDEDGVTGHEVAVSPDGRLAFVPLYSNVGVGGTGTDGRLIRVIDLASHAIVGTVDFGHGVRPHRPVFGPRDGLLYVTTELDQTVSIIDPAALKIVGSVPTGAPESHMLAISSDGRRGYTANVKGGSVSVLDLAARRLVTVIPVAPVVQRIALSADNRWAFTADQTKLRLVVIDTTTNSIATSIPLPGLAFGTAATPDGRWLLACIPALKMVAVIDLSLMKVVRHIDVPKAPQEILVRPDGGVAYVSCDAAAQVAVINLSDWSINGLIGVGPADDGLAWAPAP